MGGKAIIFECDHRLAFASRSWRIGLTATICCSNPVAVLAWFNVNNFAIRELLGSKNEAHAAKLRNPNSAALHDKWKELRSSSQRELRHMENQWWTDKGHEIQQYADNNEPEKLYEAIKAVHGPRQRSIHPVKSKDGNKESRIAKA